MPWFAINTHISRCRSLQSSVEKISNSDFDSNSSIRYAYGFDSDSNSIIKILPILNVGFEILLSLSPPPAFSAYISLIVLDNYQYDRNSYWFRYDSYSNFWNPAHSDINSKTHLKETTGPDSMALVISFVLVIDSDSFWFNILYIILCSA